MPRKEKYKPIPVPNKKHEQVLRKIYSGVPVPAYSSRTPKSVTELAEAGLIRLAMRPIVFHSCWVPVEGYTPMSGDTMATEKLNHSLPSEIEKRNKVKIKGRPD